MGVIRGFSLLEKVGSWGNVESYISFYKICDGFDSHAPRCEMWTRLRLRIWENEGESVRHNTLHCLDVKSGASSGTGKIANIVER